VRGRIAFVPSVRAEVGARVSARARARVRIRARARARARVRVRARARARARVSDLKLLQQRSPLKSGH